MTQHALIMAYVQEYGEIIPAKVSGTSFMGGFFGSETPRRARELRKEGKLVSEGYGRFEKFYLPATQPMKEGEVITISELQTKIEDLRKKYVAESDPKAKDLIARRGKLLKTALEMAEKDELAKNAVEALYD